MNGFLTFPVIDTNKVQFSEWTTSSAMTSSRLITILSLSRSVLSTKGLESDVIQIITHYGVLLESVVGSSFRFPSLSYLIKYWQDPFGI